MSEVICYGRDQSGRKKGPLLGPAEHQHGLNKATRSNRSCFGVLPVSRRDLWWARYLDGQRRKAYTVACTHLTLLGSWAPWDRCGAWSSLQPAEHCPTLFQQLGRSWLSLQEKWIARPCSGLLICFSTSGFGLLYCHCHVRSLSQS